jgi:hypothetical protein
MVQWGLQEELKAVEVTLWWDKAEMGLLSHGSQSRSILEALSINVFEEQTINEPVSPLCCEKPSGGPCNNENESLSSS